MARRFADYSYRENFKEVFERDKGICQICKNKIIEPLELSLDHIVARCLGGNNEVSNLQLAHKLCNNKKSRKEQFKYNKFLYSIGKKPCGSSRKK